MNPLHNASSDKMPSSSSESTSTRTQKPNTWGIFQTQDKLAHFKCCSLGNSLLLHQRRSIPHNAGPCAREQSKTASWCWCSTAISILQQRSRRMHRPITCTRHMTHQADAGWTTCNATCGALRLASGMATRSQTPLMYSYPTDLCRSAHPVIKIASNASRKQSHFCNNHTVCIEYSKQPVPTAPGQSLEHPEPRPCLPHSALPKCASVPDSTSTQPKRYRWSCL